MNPPNSKTNNGIGTEASSTRLTSLIPSNIKGGLQSKPKSKKCDSNNNNNNNNNNAMAPPPQRSKLGLDRGSSRNYRSRLDETPSHAGGVNLEVERRLKEKLRERRMNNKGTIGVGHGQFSHSHSQSHSGDSYRKQDRDRDRDRDKSSRDQERDRDRSSSRRRRDRDYDYHSDSERNKKYDRHESRKSKKSTRKRHCDLSRSRNRSRSRSRSGSYSPERGGKRDDRRDIERDQYRGRDSERGNRSSSTRRESDYGRDREGHRDRDRDRDRSRNSSNRRHNESYRGDSERRNSEKEKTPNMTPSTQSSYSSSRQYSECTSSSRRREDVAYAETPIIHQNDSRNNSHYRPRENATPRGRRSAWESETPMNARGKDQDDILKRSALTSVRAFPGGGPGGPGETPMTEMSKSTNNNNDSTRNADEEFDREFYLADDEEFVQDGKRNMGRFLYESAKTKQREEEMKRRRDQNEAGTVNPATSLREMKRNALKDDQEAWENSRLLSSGAAVRGDVDLDFKSEDDTRITLLVHQVKPPFLGKGASAFSRVRHAVPTVKDNTSDFAKMAREGSESLRRLREKKEKNTMRNKFWQIGGSRMGKAVGVKEEEVASNGEASGGQIKDSGQENSLGEVDYKKSAGYASHVDKDGKKSEAVSEFALKKSIREQRQYLPAYTVRDDLLNVVRENNVIVVVGETGSG